MMLTLQIAADLEARLLEHAKFQSVPPEDLALEALKDKLASDEPIVRLSKTVWQREFHALLASMPDGNVNADLCRASVYEGRGA